MQEDALAGDPAGAEPAGVADLTSTEPRQRAPGAAPDQDSAPDESASRPWRFMRETTTLLAIAVTIALLLKTFVIQPFFIPSGSMEDTLLIGDKVLVSKFVYHLRAIRRGDIVVFNGAGSWNPPVRPAPASHNLAVRGYDDTVGWLLRSVRSLFGTSPGQIDYIKRVIGLPGDRVRCCTALGQVTVNGVPLHESSYLATGVQPSQYPFDIVVPPGRLWVMGDNRLYSADSRLHLCGYRDPETMCAAYDRDGTIPEKDVVGRAFLVMWPPGQFKVLSIPSTFDQPGLLHPAASVLGTDSSGRGGGTSAGGITIRPSASYLPLAAGFGFALPLTALRRRIWRRARAARPRRKLPRAEGRLPSAVGVRLRSGSGSLRRPARAMARPPLESSSRYVLPRARPDRPSGR
jgi:signal peptidase I